MTRWFKAEHVAVVILEVGMLCAAMLLAYMWTWDARSPFHDLRPAEVLDLMGNPVSTLRAGQHFWIGRYACFDRNDITGKTYTVWENGLVFIEPDVPLRKPDLGCQMRYYPTMVPSDLPTGRVFTRRTFVEIPFNWLVGSKRFELPPVKLTILP